MSRILLYCFFAAIILVWLLLPSKKKTKKTNPDQNSDSPVVLIDQANALIDKMHNARDSYVIKLNSLRAKILACNDINACDELSKNSADMNHYCIRMDQLITDMNEIVRNQQLELLEKKYYELQELADAMDCTSEQLSFIVPERQAADEPESTITSSEEETSFFSGIETEKDLQKRYHALTKAFHPDTGFGDEKSFRKMQEDYEKQKERIAKL